MTTPINNVLNIRKDNSFNRKMFLDEGGGTDIARFDQAKYDIFLKQDNLMNSYYWKPLEINMVQDRIDYNTKLEPHHKHIFSSNIGSQIMGDSLLGRSQSLALLSICSLSEIENCLNTISFFENQIHSKSYSHILNGIYNNPGELFDSLKYIPEITGRMSITVKYCNELLDCIYRWRAGLHTDVKEIKRRLYLYLVSVNALEGSQFFISFACSFNFGENKQLGMNGTSDINRLIANDESLHLAFNTTILKLLPSDDPDFIEIIAQNREEASSIYNGILHKEVAFSEYLFQHGSMMGMNHDIMCANLYYRGRNNMKRIGLDYDGPIIEQDSMPWLRSYLNEESVQKPPQETDITGYMKNTVIDIDTDSFDDFEL